MARPESTRDIEINDIEFGRIDFNQIATDAALLKGYTAFLEAVSKAGATVDMRYSGAHFSRCPSQAEMRDQLETAQNRWDEGKKQYEMLASVGEVEYSWQRSQAETWAKGEDMPFPPEVDPIEAIDAVIRDEEANA